MSRLLGLADRITVLFAGRIVAEGRRRRWTGATICAGTRTAAAAVMHQDQWSAREVPPTLPSFARNSATVLYETSPHRCSTGLDTIQGYPPFRPDTGALGVVAGAVGLELPGRADHLGAELAQLGGDRVVLEMPVRVERLP